MVFGEAKIGNNGDFTKNQRPGIPEIASGKGTFYGTNAQSIAERLSVAPDANGRFRIPQSQIQGVYIGTYERDAPQNNKTRALNDAFRQSGGFGRGSD